MRRSVTCDAGRISSVRTLLGLTMAVGLLGCSGAEAPFPELLPLGTWGAQDAGAIVTEDEFHLHIGCTFGDVMGRVSLDAEGRFVVDGSYQPRAYPVESGPTVPAQFSGMVRGKTLTVAVAVNDTVTGEVRAFGPVEIRLGVEPGLANCPICTIERMRERREQ